MTCYFCGAKLFNKAGIRIYHVTKIINRLVIIIPDLYKTKSTYTINDFINDKCINHSKLQNQYLTCTFMVIRKRS